LIIFYKNKIINRLSSSIGKRDEVPNQELAQKICENRDTSVIEELISNLSGTNKAIQSDCIKVLYEIGYVQHDKNNPGYDQRQFQ